MRFTALLAALLLYAGLGSPTPDALTPALVLIAFFLAIACGAPGLMACLPSAGSASPLWQTAARALLVYGLTVPLLTALVAGNTPGLVLRDLAAFVFLLLPLLLVYALPAGDKARLWLAGMIAFIGFTFAARVALPAWGPSLSWGHVPDPLYLANAPSTLFAALLLLGYGGLFVACARRRRDVCAGLALLAAAAVILMAMMMIAQRAYLGAAGLSIGFWLVLLLLRAPGRLWRLLVLLIPAAVLAWPVLTEAGAALAHKTVQVGFNNRFEEARAVLESVAGRPGALWWGQGWGATFESPAVGGMNVNFTHSLLTAMILKTGLAGLALTLGLIGFLMAGAARQLRCDPVMALALGLPLVINIFLYASYKSLDFGLLLLILGLYSRPENLQEKPDMVYVKQGFPQEQATR